MQRLKNKPQVLLREYFGRIRERIKWYKMCQGYQKNTYRINKPWSMGFTETEPTTNDHAEVGRRSGTHVCQICSMVFIWIIFKSYLFLFFNPFVQSRLYPLPGLLPDYSQSHGFTPSPRGCPQPSPAPQKSSTHPETSSLSWVSGIFSHWSHNLTIYNTPSFEKYWDQVPEDNKSNTQQTNIQSQIKWRDIWRNPTKIRVKTRMLTLPICIQ